MLLLLLAACALTRYPALADDVPARPEPAAALVEQAREAARKDQNQISADLFARAIAEDPALRSAVAREYADQLTYSGKSADAIPLYREVLARPLPAAERTRALRGLALALLWDGKFAEAIAAWQQIVDAAPDDADARKNLRQALLAEARDAAGQNQNARAADLYARAIALDPGNSQGLERDYADQLTYSDRAGEAVPLYRQILQRDLTGEERARAERGLALALLWSGKSQEAAEAWKKILQAAPEDADARKNLREAVIAEARLAASQNQNAKAAGLFAQAIDLAPERRLDILREYADQLSYSRRSKEAIPLYREILASGKSSGQELRQTRRGLALAELWSGDFTDAIDAWSAIARQDPKDVDARKNLADALVGAAREAASKNRNAQSASLFARAISVAPARRLELLVEYADQLTYSGQSVQAVALYREALASRKLAAGQRLRAQLGLALALSWSNEPEKALGVYDAILKVHPDSVEALIGRGKVLTQLDRNQEALAAFDAATRLDPGNVEATRNAAQALSYLGRQRLALQRISSLAAADSDTSSLFIAARAAYWMGRPDRARSYLEKILAADPGNADARKLLADLDLSQQPLTSLNAAVSTQNDGLVIAGATLRHGVTTSDGLVTYGGQLRSIELIPKHGDNIQMTGLGVFGRDRLSDALEVNASLFVNTVTSPDFVHVEPTGDAWLTFWPNDMWRFDFSAGRSYFDDVKSVSDNVLIDTLGMSFDYLPTPDLRLTARTNYGWITDGNERFFGQAEVEQRVLKVPDVFVGARYTNFNFAKPYLDNGYFNPDWLNSVVGTLRVVKQLAPDWTATASGSGGYEWQKDGQKPTWTAGLATAYTPSPNLSVRMAIDHQDSADVGGSSAFRRTTVSAGFDYRW